MLPSRSRLQSWNPDSLLPPAAAVDTAGKAVYGAVRTLDDEIGRMPGAGAWQGEAHDAADVMFDKATTRSSGFLDYSASFAAAVRTGGSTVGNARTALLGEADRIDQGELSVTDQWVVLIKPAGMSAAKAAALQAEAETAQAEINALLIALDSADDAAAQQVMLAMAEKGTDFGAGIPGPMVMTAPADEAPNPATEMGRALQDASRARDMATTVREIVETEDEYGNKYTTITMVDGSKQVVTEHSGRPPSAHPYPEGTLEVNHYDKDGNFLSETMTHVREDGSSRTDVWYADGTHVVMSRTADGKCEGGVTTADGRHGVLPEEFFTDPVPTTIGGLISGLGAQSERGIPGLSAQALDDVRVGAKFGGPALGLATTVYNMATAESGYEACVAAISGGAGVAGGIAADVLLASVAPAAFPLLAVPANIVGTLAFGYAGGIVGNIVCPK